MQTIDAEKQAHIRRMIETDAEFRRLHEEHQDLHRKIEQLMKRRRHHTPEEEALLVELKKRKLAVKDAMGRILFHDEFRSQTH